MKRVFFSLLIMCLLCSFGSKAKEEYAFSMEYPYPTGPAIVNGKELTYEDIKKLTVEEVKKEVYSNPEKYTKLSFLFEQCAESNQNAEVLQVLIDSLTEDPKEQQDYLDWMFRDAVFFSNNVEVIKKLVKLGADVNHIDSTGKSVLMHALRNKNLKVARYLIEAGADVKARDDKGNTTLLHLVKKEIDAPDIVKLLIDKGVDTTAENYYCRTAMQFAEACGLSATAKILENAGIEPSGKESTDKNCTNTKNHWGETFCPYNPTPKTKKSKWYDIFK